jgi:hypothetical protein
LMLGCLSGPLRIKEIDMLSRLKKTAIVALSALTLAVPFATTATPAAAQGWHGGGWHGGGWHGGGWHGGGWHGGGWHGGGWHGGGWGWRGGGWRGGGWGGGWGWGGPAAAGLIGGLALGSLAASAAAPYYGYGSYGGCYLQSQPVYNRWGQFLGYRPIRVCY